MALLKVMASKTFELCAREASQIFGGASYVRSSGKGAVVERLYRDVRGTAIPGGSEEILMVIPFFFFFVMNLFLNTPFFFCLVGFGGKAGAQTSFALFKIVVRQTDFLTEKPPLKR